VNGRLIYRFALVGTTRPLNGIQRLSDLSNHRLALAGRRVLEVQQEIGADTKHPFGLQARAGEGLVFEYDSGDVDGGGVEFRAGGDGVVAGLETRDRGDDDVEGDGPRGGVLLGRVGVDLIARRQLENFAELEATIGDDGVIFLLVGIESLYNLLRLGCGSVFRERAEDLTTDDSADIEVVSENGGVGCGDGERNLGKCGIKGLDADHGILLVEQTESAEEASNLDVWVQRPHADVITVLIRDSRALGAKLEMDTVPLLGRLEQLASRSDRCRVRVLGVVDALGLCERTGGQFTYRGRQ
jgi:hypothetical protein